MKTVSYTLDKLPPLTKSQEESLRRIGTLSDDDINLDDMPELSATELTQMKPAQFYKPLKKQITARVDADVLAWLKAGGKGY